MILVKETRTLTNKNITDMVSIAVAAYEEGAKKRACNTVALALSIEETLLKFKECYGANCECTLVVQKTLGKISLEFHHIGPQDNPVANGDQDDITVDILNRLEVTPRYVYRGGTRDNVVSFVTEQKARKNQMIISILLAVVLAFICYEAMSFLPAEIQTSLAEGLIAPLFNKSMMIISTIATPLVFLGILNGIIEIGDIRSLGSIGKTFLSNMNKTYLFSGLAFTILGIVVYGVDLQANATGEGDYLAQTVQLVLDIIPDHLLEAFSVDNDLQVVTIAVLVGVAILQMRNNAIGLKQALNVCSDVVNQMMLIVLKLLPFIVFIGILNILCTNMKGLGKLYVIFLLFIATSIIVVVYMFIRVKRIIDVPIKLLLQKQMPTAMINLTTSSQVSAYTENVICCKDKFGISEKLVNFGLPLGIVLYMPNGACFFGVTVWGLSSIAGIHMGIFQMIITMLACIVVAIAAPPIPGSAITVLPILLSIIVLPTEMFPIAVLLATFLGYFLPLINGFCLQLEMLITAKQLEMIDEEALRQPVK